MSMRKVVAFRVQALYAGSVCSVLDVLDDSGAAVLTILTTDPERDGAEAISILQGASAQEPADAREALTRPTTTAEG